MMQEFFTAIRNHLYLCGAMLIGYNYEMNSSGGRQSLVK